MTTDPWTISYFWLALKDASWVSAVGLVCIVTLGLSYILKARTRRIERSA